jgi:ribosomal protein S12 methylthiotransferase accessory factor
MYTGDMERDEVIGQRQIFNIPVIKTKLEILHELTQPCSRFSFDVRRIHSDFRNARLANRLDPFAENELLLATNTPANWQAFIRFLNERGVTSSKVVSSLPVRHDMPKIYTVSLRSGPAANGDPGHAVDRGGFGASCTNTQEALSKACGELLERYFSARYRTEELMFVSFKALQERRYGPRPLDIFSLNDFLPWQKELFPAYNRDMHSPLGWVRGMNMTRQTPVYLPAQLVYWNYQRGDEPLLQECNTSGTAGHFTRDEATLAALLELIQRDGFMIHWLKIKHPRRIDQETLTDPDVQALLERFRQSLLEVHLLDTTTDIGIPTCLAVLLDPRGGRYEIHLASGIGFTERDALLSALAELIVVFGAQLHSEGPIVLEEPYEPFRKPISNLQRLRVWRTKKMYDIFLSFIQGPLETVGDFMHGVEQYDTVAARLAYVQERLAALGEGYEVYTHEFEDSLLREIGFHVVRAIVPRIMGIYLFEQSGSLGAQRLSSVPPKLGLEIREDLNPWPHPFP